MIDHTDVRHNEVETIIFCVRLLYRRIIFKFYSEF